VHANVCITPQNSSGFTPHYDTHEVLVLQIGGSKVWRIYDPPLKLPHRSQPFNAASHRLPPRPRPRFELEMRPGDLLYLPRGYVSPL
jgi:ribosomal protein L16 Arg81 hydroxylase